MKIAYEASAIQGNRTGVEYYCLRLFEALRALDGVEVIALSDHPIPEIPDAIVQRSKMPRVLWWRFALPDVLRKMGASSFHAPITPLPLGMRIPAVTTVHGVAWLVLPECYSAWERTIHRLWLRAACRRAAALVCVSETTRRDVLTHFPQAAAKARTIHNGAVAAPLVPTDEGTRRLALEKFRITSRFVLAAGRIERQKNPVRVLRAFARETEAPDLGDVCLVFAGAPGNAMSDAVAAARELGVANRVVFCSYVKDELSALYQAAEMLIYASLYEGFGHAPFEAISLGTPVVASDIPGIREVLGSGGELVDPLDTDAIANAMRRVLRDPAFRTQLLERGRERLKQFSWHTTAESVASLHRELVESTTR